MPLLKIARRGKLGLLASHLSPSRIRYTLTGSTYFDARYEVNGANKHAIQPMLSSGLVEALSSCDQDFPPILIKNGWLSFDNKRLLYTEGPYDSEEISSLLTLVAMQAVRLQLVSDIKGALDPRFFPFRGCDVIGETAAFA